MAALVRNVYLVKIGPKSQLQTSCWLLRLKLYKLYFRFACMFTFEGNIQCGKEGITCKRQPWNALTEINKMVFTGMPLR